MKSGRNIGPDGASSEAVSPGGPRAGSTPASPASTGAPAPVGRQERIAPAPGPGSATGNAGAVGGAPSSLAPVSALFIDPTGPYPSLVEDCWDESRDARLYAGARPVVAHPPCARWSRFWWSARHLGKGLGDDDGCFESALLSVRKWGGVLEHPEGTHAWERFGLLRPTPDAWTRVWMRPDEWVCVLDQQCWGHRARKRTWLVAVGASRLPHPRLSTERQSAYLTTPRLGRKVYVSSGPGASRSAELRKLHGIELMGAREQRLTPEPFARLLVDIAVSVRGDS